MGVVDQPDATQKAPTRTTFLLLETGVLCATHLAAIFAWPLGARYTFYMIAATSTSERQLLSTGSSFALVLYIVYASGDPLAKVGLRRIRLPADLVAMVIACCWLIPYLLRTTSSAVPFYGPTVTSMSPLWLIALRAALVGVYEEFFYRGYLVSRVEELTRSKWFAVGMPALFFGFVHSYEGFRGMCWALALGLIYGAIFLKNRSIWPLAIGHACIDFYLYYTSYVRIGLA